MLAALGVVDGGPAAVVLHVLDSRHGASHQVEVEGSVNAGLGKQPVVVLVFLDGAAAVVRGEEGHLNEEWRNRFKYKGQRMQRKLFSDWFQTITALN